MYCELTKNNTVKDEQLTRYCAIASHKFEDQQLVLAKINMGHIFIERDNRFDREGGVMSRALFHNKQPV
jgi:hypothetical protein